MDKGIFVSTLLCREGPLSLIATAALQYALFRSIGAHSNKGDMSNVSMDFSQPSFLIGVKIHKVPESTQTTQDVPSTIICWR